MVLEKKSPCKVNLLLNILGRRADGFHELETIMHPVDVFDHLSFARVTRGFHLTCSDPGLPVDSGNLVHRAAMLFFQRTEIRDGVRIHLEKKIPMAAGLGGGSGNAATTLLGLNEIFGKPLSFQALHNIAASLGSDIPFFLQDKPALATGRGEVVKPLDRFTALQGAAFLLIHPGFGIATAWAYAALARFPASLNGEPGRAGRIISLLQGADLPAAGAEFYNSLEAPAFEKYPLLVLFQEFLRADGAAATLMSGSGSTTFALVGSEAAAQDLAGKFKARFGDALWLAVVPVKGSEK
jgi:4-diphosphocytidyl-2-C-methyl-D-erythritol kinase